MRHIRVDVPGRFVGNEEVGAVDHGTGDCDYCPLLQAMVASKAPAVLPVAALAPVAPQTIDAAAPPRFRHPNGLGSRGPPRIS